MDAPVVFPDTAVVTGYAQVCSGSDLYKLMDPPPVRWALHQLADSALFYQLEIQNST